MGLLLDVGSHSVKVYRSPDPLRSGETHCSGDTARPEVHRRHAGRLRHVTTMTWPASALAAHDVTALDRLLVAVRREHPGMALRGFGTAAMRASQALAAAVEQCFARHGGGFEVITQAHEAALVREAVVAAGVPAELDVVNVGGRSIQVVTGTGTALLEHGIVDLNAEFALTAPPQQRRAGDCVAVLRERIPVVGSFVYTGGERTYLEAMGLRLSDGWCGADDFRLMAGRLERMSGWEQAACSPFDAGWMSGAVASNCIVLALLEVSGTTSFLASDVNVADGVLHLVGGAEGG